MSEIGETDVVKHGIDARDPKPIKQLPRSLTNALRSVVNEQVQEIINNDVIRPSCSPCASPTVLVKKKDGTWRFCVDFRTLNDVNIKDAYPLPQVNDLTENLSGQYYFSTLDLASGYWQVKITDESKSKTTFVVPGGSQFEFNRISFGLCDAVPTFQRLMSRGVEGLSSDKCLVYLDDILVTGKTLDGHCSSLKVVQEFIQKVGLKLKITMLSGLAAHPVQAQLFS